MIAAVTGLLVLLLFYLGTWFLVGIDPPRGTIVPLFEPPDGMSPSAARYISTMDYDNECAAVAIMNMAVKGWLSITGADGTYWLQRRPSPLQKLSDEEVAFQKALFEKNDFLELSNSNHAAIGGALRALRYALRRKYYTSYFIKNTFYLIPGVFITVLTILATTLSGDFEKSAVTLFWLSQWSMGTGMLVWFSVLLWRSARQSIFEIPGAIAISLFSIPFILGEAYGLYVLGTTMSAVGVGVVAAMISLTFLFWYLLRARTLLGRKAMDRIEGFKMYLEAAEKNDLVRLESETKNPEGLSVELFERFLPYAAALGVANKWAARFADALAVARTVPASTELAPAWYCCDAPSSPDFASRFSTSLSGAIAFSAAAPVSIGISISSSDSGSGGGGAGSSGGGRGSSGGGGW